MSKIANMATYRSTPDLKAVAHRFLSRRRSTDFDANDRPISAQREHRLGFALLIIVGSVSIVAMVVLSVLGGLFLLTGGPKL